MIIKLLKDLQIDHRETGNEHCRYGWVQINCPFCIEGDDEFHMGFNIEGNYGFNCYRCGYHSEIATLSKLLRIGRMEARAIVSRYLHKGGKSTQTAKIEAIGQKCILPLGHVIKPENEGYRYLRGRLPHYSVQELHYLVKKHRIYYTDSNPHSPDGKLMGMGGRVTIPTWYCGQIVTYQGRDYTGKQKQKYMNPAPDQEIRNIKSIVWGYDFCNFDTVLVCEGVFDALAVGDGAVHLGGTAFTLPQIGLLKEFRKVYICFDKGAQAQAQASKLANSLSLHTDVSIIKVEAPDVGSATKEEIESLRRLLK